MKKNRKYHYCRSIRTTQEKRNFYKNGLTDGEFCVKIRSKRSPKQLPDAWDDYFIHTPQCWKDHRKTQYKTEKNSFMFGFVPEGGHFKMGNRVYRKFAWADCYGGRRIINGYWYDAIELDSDKGVIISYHEYVEYPI